MKTTTDSTITIKDDVPWLKICLSREIYLKVFTANIIKFSLVETWCNH